MIFLRILYKNKQKCSGFCPPGFLSSKEMLNIEQTSFLTKQNKIHFQDWICRKPQGRILVLLQGRTDLPAREMLLSFPFSDAFPVLVFSVMQRVACSSKLWQLHKSFRYVFGLQVSLLRRKPHILEHYATGVNWSGSLLVFTTFFFCTLMVTSWPGFHSGP